MGQNTTNISVSFETAELAKIKARIAELKLPGRTGVSQYFQMLRELDAHFHLTKYYHEADGRLHFFPPQAAALPYAQPEDFPLQVAEELTTELDQASKAVQAKKHPGSSSRSPRT